jgi:hypothetical protein
LLNRRALLLLFAGVSLFSILFASLGVSAAAADTTRHCSNAAPRAHADESGDAADHCRHARSRDSCDVDHCRNRSRSPTPKETAVPPSEPAAPAAPASTTPPPRPRDASVTAPGGKGSSRRAPSLSPNPTTRPPSAAGPRPPVLAPPPLTIPVVGPVIAGGKGLGAGYFIALSTIVVAATIAVVSLVLVRRSG